MKYNVEVDALVVPNDDPKGKYKPSSVEFSNITDLPSTLETAIRHIEIVGKIKDLEIYIHGEEETSWGEKPSTHQNSAS